MIKSASAPANPLLSGEAAHAELIHTTGAPDAPIPQRQRWWIDFQVRGDLRFISHHDTLRFFRRAIARAGIPVRFSVGFNPHPKMTIPLPRALGVSSDAEAIVIESERDIDGGALAERLGAQMPKGIALRGVRRLELGERPQPDTVTYRFRPEHAWPQDAADRIQRMLDSSSLSVERADHKTKRTRVVDIRPFLMDAHLEGQDFVFTIRVTGTGSAKPSELIELLIDHAGPVNHRIHRQSVRWR